MGRITRIQTVTLVGPERSVRSSGVERRINERDPGVRHPQRRGYLRFLPARPWMRLRAGEDNMRPCFTEEAQAPEAPEPPSRRASRTRKFTSELLRSVWGS